MLTYCLHCYGVLYYCHYWPVLSPVWQLTLPPGPTHGATAAPPDIAHNSLPAHQQQESSSHCNIKTIFPGIGIFIIKIRHTWNSIIFIMRILLLVRLQHYTETNNNIYPQTSNISHTLLGNKIVDHSDVVWASPVGAAETISSFAT